MKFKLGSNLLFVGLSKDTQPKAWSLSYESLISDDDPYEDTYVISRCKVVDGPDALENIALNVLSWTGNPNDVETVKQGISQFLEQEASEKSEVTS